MLCAYWMHQKTTWHATCDASPYHNAIHAKSVELRFFAVQPSNNNAAPTQTQRTANATRRQHKFGVRIVARLSELGQVVVRTTQLVQRPNSDVSCFAMSCEYEPLRRLETIWERLWELSTNIVYCDHIKIRSIVMVVAAILIELKKS